MTDTTTQPTDPTTTDDTSTTGTSAVAFPTAGQVRQAVASMLANGDGLDSITCERVLGVPQAEIDAARNALAPRDTRLYPSNSFLEQRRLNNRPLARSRKAWVFGPGSRDSVAQAVGARTENLNIVLEINSDSGHNRHSFRLNDGLLHVQLPDAYSPSFVRYGNAKFEVARPDLVNILDSAESWTIYPCPWDDRFPGYAVKTRGDYGAGQTIVVLVNLFGSPKGQFVRSGLDVRTDALMEIINDALQYLPKVQNETSSVAPNDRHKKLVELSDVVLSMVAFGRSSVHRLEEEISAQDRRIRDLERKIEDARQTLIDAADARREALTAKQNLEAQSSGELLRSLAGTLAKLDHIKEKKPVKSVTFESVDHETYMRVDLYDLVVAAGAQSRRIFLPNISFRLQLTGRRGRNALQWITDNLNNRPAVHPHVYSHGGTCWGNIDAVMAERLAQQDWPMVVDLVLRFLQRVSPNDAATSLSAFDTSCRLPVGWIYPEGE